MKIVFTLFFITLFCWGSGHAQKATDSDFAKMLPPLQALIDSALIHSPALGIADNNILLGKNELKRANRTWLDLIQLQGDMRYGSEFYYNQQESPLIDMNEEPDKVRYGVGVLVRVPFSQIFNRGVPRTAAKLSIETAKLQKEETEKIITQTVIATYYALLNKRKMLDFSSQMASSGNMAYEQAKIEFAANKISMSDYTAAYENSLNLQNSYEILKNEFERDVRLMEELIGIKLFN